MRMPVKLSAATAIIGPIIHGIGVCRRRYTLVSSARRRFRPAVILVLLDTRLCRNWGDSVFIALLSFRPKGEIHLRSLTFVRDDTSVPGMLRHNLHAEGGALWRR